MDRTTYGLDIAKSVMQLLSRQIAANATDVAIETHALRNCAFGIPQSFHRIHA